MKIKVSVAFYYGSAEKGRSLLKVAILSRFFEVNDAQEDSC